MLFNVINNGISYEWVGLLNSLSLCRLALGYK